MKNQPAQYVTRGTVEVAAFLDAVNPMICGEARASGDQLLDHVRHTPGIVVPKALDELLGKVGSQDEKRVLDAVGRGVRAFRAAHGVDPTADVVEAALQQGGSAMYPVDRNGQVVLDSANSGAHDQGSLQPNRAVVAIISCLAEAIPFASYLPTDIQSNEARLAILSHQAGSAYGDYGLGDIMDGVSAGGVYTSSSRMVRFDLSGSAPFVRKFSDRSLATDEGFCDPAADGVPVLRGRTIVYVNGRVAATDTLQGSAANSPISGSVKIGSTDHAITGHVTVATGAVQLTSISPALPAGTQVTAQAFVDYEKAPALIPSVIVQADVYKLYANPWRVMTGVSVDALTQIRNELGIDAQSEALVSIRAQMAMERHYQALRMAAAIGRNTLASYNFDYDNQIGEKTRAQIWQDAQSVFGDVDQAMANKTMDHGITHLYVPAFVAAQLQSLPSTLFVSSGITARPSIYRVGRLFDKYDVYYSPKVVSQSADLKAATLLAVGRSTNVARCPVVLGDAVSPTYLGLGMVNDLQSKAAMYARDFTVVNPHEPSALGCAVIEVNNMF